MSWAFYELERLQTTEAMAALDRFSDIVAAMPPESVKDIARRVAATYVGTSYASGDTYGSAPNITSVDYTTYAYGSMERGTTGYVILYGSNFQTPYGNTSIVSSFGSPAYLSPTQINLYYSIPLSASSGTYPNDIGVSTPYGSSSKDFYVWDPPPSISYISPTNVWSAGSTNFVTIVGSGFGSSPSASFSDAYSSNIPFLRTSAGDGWVSGTLAGGADDPGGGVTVTVTASSYSGSYFQGPPGGGGGNTTTGGAVTPLPPQITGTSPQAWLAGTAYQDVLITGTHFPPACPSGGLSGTGAGTEPLFVGAFNCGTTSVHATIQLDQLAPGPTATLTLRWGGVSATFGVPIVPIQMKLTKMGTVISADGKYSEDTTIKVTVVRGDDGTTLTTFTGDVGIAEDTQISGYTAIYSQNQDHGLPLSVTITSNGTATFVAKSLAGPSSDNGVPGDAKIKTTNFPVYGSDLAVPQWVISAQPIDVRSTGAVFDWVQARAKHIFDTATGDTATILATVSTYTIEAYTPTEFGHSSGSALVLMPYLLRHRLDTGPSTFCGNISTAEFTNTLIHEARHAYQYAQSNIAGNDPDHDFLVNTVGVAPTTIFQDSTASRQVCNTNTMQTENRAYNGPTIFDAYTNNVAYAWEQDAEVFATMHDH